jgi:hypothetical protein
VSVVEAHASARLILISLQLHLEQDKPMSLEKAISGMQNFVF